MEVSQGSVRRSGLRGGSSLSQVSHLPPFAPCIRVPLDKGCYTAPILITRCVCPPLPGAGISTPAIPDFRSSTGLFKTLRTTSAIDLTSAPPAAPKKTSKKPRGRPPRRVNVPIAKPKERGLGGMGMGMGAAGVRSGKDLFDIKCLSVSRQRLSHGTRPRVPR
jgi:hypothetical protein